MPLSFAPYDPEVPPIREFQGDFRFLSNFWPAPVSYDGLTYPSVEHAYQASKTLKREKRQLFVNVTAGQAKRMGVIDRPDWERIKVDIMRHLLERKFQPGTLLASQLLATGEALIQEGNRWGDTFWGVDIRSQIGSNHLGTLLMQIRASLRNPASRHPSPSP